MLTHRLWLVIVILHQVYWVDNAVWSEDGPSGIKHQGGNATTVLEARYV